MLGLSLSKVREQIIIVIYFCECLTCTTRTCYYTLYISSDSESILSNNKSVMLTESYYTYIHIMIYNYQDVDTCIIYIYICTYTYYVSILN